MLYVECHIDDKQSSGHNGASVRSRTKHRILSETWLKSNRGNITAIVKEYDYVLVHNIRKNRKKENGGGVGILLKTDISYKRINNKQFTSFEHVMVKIILADKTSLLLVSIYRVLFVSITIFLDEIVELFEMLVTLNDNIILAGDVNIHMDEDSLYPCKFKDILDTFNIAQHVDRPTHIQGHTLDIIATFGGKPIISNIESNAYDVSHHSLVDFHVLIVPEAKHEKVITYRSLKQINSDRFSADVSGKLAISCQSFGDNVKKYNEVLSEILDEHAPVKTRTSKVVPHAPWFDTEYDNLRKQRRKAERQYKKSKRATDKEKYINLRKQTTKLAHKKKCKHYGEKLEGANTKILYSTINKLLDNDSEVILPDAKSDVELANSFQNYFTEKIEKIRATFTQDSNIDAEDIPPVQAKLLTFENATMDEIRQIVSAFGVKCSPEDPVPACVLNTHSEVFIPIWTQLVNLSLEQGSMECPKNAVLILLIK